MDKELIEESICQIIDQLNDKKKLHLHAKFHSILLNQMYPFFDGNSRTCEILFSNDDVIKQNI